MEASKSKVYLVWCYSDGGDDLLGLYSSYTSAMEFVYAEYDDVYEGKHLLVEASDEWSWTYDEFLSIWITEEEVQD